MSDVQVSQPVRKANLTTYNSVYGVRPGSSRRRPAARGAGLLAAVGGAVRRLFAVAVWAVFRRHPGKHCDRGLNRKNSLKNILFFVARPTPPCDWFPNVTAPGIGTAEDAHDDETIGPPVSSVLVAIAFLSTSQVGPRADSNRPDVLTADLRATPTPRRSRRGSTQ